jgi:hypothetical protein
VTEPSDTDNAQKQVDQDWWPGFAAGFIQLIQETSLNAGVTLKEIFRRWDIETAKALRENGQLAKIAKKHAAEIHRIATNGVPTPPVSRRLKPKKKPGRPPMASPETRQRLIAEIYRRRTDDPYKRLDEIYEDLDREKFCSPMPRPRTIRKWIRDDTDRRGGRFKRLASEFIEKSN